MCPEHLVKVNLQSDTTNNNVCAKAASACVTNINHRRIPSQPEHRNITGFAQRSLFIPKTCEASDPKRSNLSSWNTATSIFTEPSPASLGLISRVWRHCPGRSLDGRSDTQPCRRLAETDAHFGEFLEFVCVSGQE